MSINRVILSGNLTRSAELRQTASGTSVLSFGVAVNERRKNNQTGEWEEYANFIDCALFGQRAQAIAQYLTKGTKVAIDGKLRYSSWQTQEGQKRSKLDVIVDEIEFMSARQDQQAQQPAPGQTQRQAPRQASQQATQQYGSSSQGYAQPAASVYDVDIPF